MKHMLDLQALRGGNPSRDGVNSTPTIVISTVSLSVCISSTLSAALCTP
ncbi:SapB/AmfS family lanthipeptide [Microbacterium sp. M1A1_1b]|nr:SapB/AmfS family lanthipeptide [Curtobacterium sp. VKM Ac-2922]MCJ1714826.1 SapB/AmfS family lanthipeptide [Curtobacterium sp. VKM Ac-2922]